jgi:hypothetical protein
MLLYCCFTAALLLLVPESKLFKILLMARLGGPKDGVRQKLCDNGAVFFKDWSLRRLGLLPVYNGPLLQLLLHE